MDTQISYYLQRKNEIDKLKRNNDLNTSLKHRALDVISGDLEQAVSESFRANNSIDKITFEDQSTFDERFQDYLRRISDDREYDKDETESSEEENQKKKDT